MKLIAGLGNPGKQYDQTRHNIGFETLKELARQLAADPPRLKFQGLCSEGAAAGERLLLLAPQTYMNRSGTSVRQAFDFYKLALSDVLIICDEFQLALGQIRIRHRGSDGGQHGLADVLASLASDQVPRLRLGVGPLPSGRDPAEFVLSKFSPGERDEVNQAIARGAEAALAWATEGIERAMNQFNRRHERP